MTDLLNLQPRMMGGATVEPSVAFASSPYTMHDRDRCPATWCCAGSTDACNATNPTNGAN